MSPVSARQAALLCVLPLSCRAEVVSLAVPARSCSHLFFQQSPGLYFYAEYNHRG